MPVAFLRGSAWIEIFTIIDTSAYQNVAFLRGNAWIEIFSRSCTIRNLASHSCEGMRGLKSDLHALILSKLGRILARECVD